MREDNARHGPFYISTTVPKLGPSLINLVSHWKI